MDTYQNLLVVVVGVAPTQHKSDGVTVRLASLAI